MVAGLHWEQLDLLVEAFEGSVAVCIELIVHSYVALDVILGNIHPEAERTGILKLDSITVNAESDVSVFARVGSLGMETVGFQTQGVVAVVDLTVFSVSQRKRHVVIPDCALSVIDDVPFIKVGLAVLEVPKDLGAFAQDQVNGSSGIRAQIQGSGHM